MFGSVFLGDPRQRLMASTSPPPTTTPAHVPPHISPEVALQLRIRWLEALLLGVNNDLDKKAKADKDQKGKEKAKAKVKPALPRRIARAKKEGEEAKGGMGSIDDAGEDKDEDEEEEEEEEEDPDEQTLIRRAEEIQRKLDAVVEKNDDVARFVETYDRNAHLFTPSFALSHQNPSTSPSYSSLSPSDLDALLQEMEPDIREADRSLAQISRLEKQGVTGAGKLEDYEPLMPRLTEVVKKHKEDVNRFGRLEERLVDILESYGERVDLMTRLFVEWDELVREAEAEIAKLEKQKEEKERLGL